MQIKNDLRKSGRVVPVRIPKRVPAIHVRQARIRAIPEVPARTPSPMFIEGEPPLLLTQNSPLKGGLNAGRAEPDRIHKRGPAMHGRQARRRAIPEGPAL